MIKRGGLANPLYQILFGLDDQNDAAGFGGLITPTQIIHLCSLWARSGSWVEANHPVYKNDEKRYILMLYTQE